MSEELTKLKRRRGVVRASITRVGTRLEELEGLRDQPRTPELAKQLDTKLETLDSEFKSYHFQIVDLITDEEQAEGHQEVLDDHDDHISDMGIRLKQLCSVATPPVSADLHRLLNRKLTHLVGCIASTQTLLNEMPADSVPPYWKKLKFSYQITNPVWQPFMKNCCQLQIRTPSEMN